MHPIHRRLYAEDLVRRRRSSERRRQIASQRRGRIDPNPHQIDAVMFALRRIPEGGCILADEVGLGKTIEAGLVIAQLLAEGATRVLIVVPRPLVGQWQNELYTLFAIEAVEASDLNVDVTAGGVFLAGREYAGGEKGSERLKSGPPFDLCLIDEAHEVFAGLYRRFDRHGVYDEASRRASTAHRVREVIGASPVILMTATPIQNSLSELWGLIQYIDPTGTLLGGKPDFEDVFCADKDVRTVAAEQAGELRRRLGTVVQRTLRRQAQEFLDKPFVGRRAQLFEYRMSVEERELYDDVTEYILQTNSHAFSGKSRQLLLLGFHRRMASSVAALAESLERVAARLRRLIDGREEADDVDHFTQDLEEDDESLALTSDEESPDVERPGITPDKVSIAAELERVEGFVARARALPQASKAASLVQAVRLVMDRAEDRRKVVIFTESLTTQSYLRDLLIAQAGLDESAITLFRSVNESPRVTQALRRWRDEVESEMEPHLRPSPTVAVRLALVHEFRARSSVFIASEAGAKGLNLQFCDTIVNYDLPWNPQRIEQRIGRCHRYGQKRDVTVINFLAKDNEAQRLTFDILSTKLDLFGKVLDMSDVVLQTPRSEASDELTSALGPDFETKVRRIWDRARSVEEVEAELRDLRDAMEERRQELERVRERTVGLIEKGLDQSVQEVFRRIRDELPDSLAELDADLERVVSGYLDAAGVPWGQSERDGARLLHVGSSARLPESIRDGVSVAVGRAAGTTDSLHLAHPLVDAAVADARKKGAGSFRLRFELGPDAPTVLHDRRASRGRLALTRVTYSGVEREDRLIATAVFEGDEVLRPAEAALELLKQPCADIAAFEPNVEISREHLDEVVEEELFFEQAEVSAAEQENFDRAIDQLDQFVADRVLVLERARADADRRLAAAEHQRDRAMGGEARARADARARAVTAEIEGLDERIHKLVSREDDIYQRWKAHAHERRFGPPKIERLLDAEFEIA